MAELVWRESFSVGDPAVDHEHRELIELVNAAARRIRAGAPAEEIDAAFGDLLAAVSGHFAHEERQMQRAGYPAYPEHKADHERLIDRLRELMDEAHEAPEAAAEATVEALAEWFEGHFATHDARLHGALGPHEH
ncbi:methyl-accepting chemotaxis protein/hemerythrin [Meinhardsimonia xiamenensis]|jgi:hemerythrin-like metal-binding protein|uniref:Methyl-accepting chemotaxis protein/hemerythrin n=1 Tax=Meinhardsimonia xiamenensis TaxID=990712 RepID=A0A1G9DBJ3_9RHOB|nr:hemerythrin family protein [Meinhardsimonia xiamenensis]PRX38056.1 methyl-accepting chemotaxis protein/hemerythrin [Meinhardsimonia xiamenensis]SDK61262.1 methyl-accepting chemotaxis protein/hemerythrin [Meinhardsimonia xiamenensis]